MQLYLNGRFKQILDLFQYKLLFEQSVSEIVINNNSKNYLSAFVYNSNNEFYYKIYKAELKNIFDNSNKRKILINIIMMQVIENEIMML